MAMSGIAIDEEVTTLYNDVKMKQTNKYVTFRIEKDKMVIVDEKGDACKTDDRDVDKEQFELLKAKLIDLNEPRYVLYDFGFTAKGGRKLTKLAFIFWSPDTGPLKKKMVYSSTKDAVQKKFVGVGAVFEAHDKADLNYDEMAAEIEKKA